LGFSLAFNQLVSLFSGIFEAVFGFLLRLSFGNPGAGCEICERIVLLLVFNVQQYHGNKSSNVHFKLQYWRFAACDC